MQNDIADANTQAYGFLANTRGDRACVSTLDAQSTTRDVNIRDGDGAKTTTISSLEHAKQRYGKMTVDAGVLSQTKRCMTCRITA